MKARLNCDALSFCSHMMRLSWRARQRELSSAWLLVQEPTSSYWPVRFPASARDIIRPKGIFPEFQPCQAKTSYHSISEESTYTNADLLCLSARGLQSICFGPELHKRAGQC